MATSNAMNKLIFKLHALADDYGIRSARGTLILVLDDANVQGIHTYKKFKKISENFETKNKEYMQIAFAEYGIKKLIVASGHNEGGIEVSIGDTLKILNRTYENGYVVAPQLKTTEGKKKLADFVKSQRNDEDYPIKAVIHDYEADSEAVINFTGKDLGIDGFTSDEYCLDVAAYLCVLGANEGITNHIAKRVTTCDIKADDDEEVSKGRLFLYNDGTNIVFSPGVNSLQTIAADQSEYLTKIRVIEVIDMIKSDLRNTFRTNYMGRMGNSYNNRKTLVNAVNSYLRTLSRDGYLSNDTNSYCELDVEATRSYIETVKNINTDEMEDNEILKYPIDTHIFLKVVIYVMDVVESIEINMYYTE